MNRNDIAESIAARLQSADPARPTPRELHAMEHGGFHVPADPEEEVEERCYHGMMPPPVYTADAGRTFGYDPTEAIDAAAVAATATAAGRRYGRSPAEEALLDDYHGMTAAAVLAEAVHKGYDTSGSYYEWDADDRRVVDHPSNEKLRAEFGRFSFLPVDSEARKETPIYSGCVAYFPDALAAVAQLSKVGNDKHNPGEPLHWSRGKSDDHEDCLMRHLIERGTIDTDGVRHSAKVAWRALAMLQLEIEAAQEDGDAVR